MGNFWSAEDHYCFINSFKYEEEMVTLDKYTIIRDEGRQQFIYNWLQHFPIKSLEQEFQDKGFRIEKFFGNVAGEMAKEDDSEMAVEISVA
jgi:hypothetical protein